jgi:PAS domain S-box-containing protein
MAKKPTYEELKQRLNELEQGPPNHNRAKNNLKESEARYRVFLENVSAPIVYFDNDCKIVFANKNSARHFGLAKGEMVGKSLFDLLLPEDQAESFLKRLNKVIEEKVTADFEDLVELPCGKRWFLSNVQAVKDSLDNVIGVLSISIDITDRVLAENALRQSREQYRDLVETFEDWIWQVDANGVYTYLSPRVRDIVGYEPEQLLGTKIFDLMSPDEAERVAGIFMELVAAPKPFVSLEITNLHKAGHPVMLETSGKPFFDADGKLLGFRGVGRDVTKRKKEEQENARLQFRLQQTQKMEAIETLAGGVAHDLNNVLTGIVSYPDLLLMQLPEDSPLRKPILTIKNAGKKAATIVQDLLALARRGVAAYEVVNLNALISEYLKSHEYEKLKSFHPGVEVECNLETDLLNIPGSPAHLSKTIMSLVSNAAEAMPDGGKLSISTENRYVGRPIKAYDHVEEGDYVILTVSDTGAGMSSEDMRRIFEPFFTKKVMGRSGTGLGMTVIWGTVKDHKGHIDIQSAEGEGTTFKLYFPITNQKPAKDEVKLPVVDCMGRGEPILVVDDAEDQRQIAYTILSELGYSVTTASSGEEAAEYLQNNSVALLLLDMIMDHGMDGLETYKEILKIHPNQKAIIISGLSETDRVKEAQKLGVRQFVEKPYTLDNLCIAVKNELNR